ncbi:hypothetical protein E2562_004450 [Oryza meyeriana var. granulata]|uniref:DUF834 domain-containing protein n=1 Tax=Oryza meyeriana var. granulata TaxID=110450 RepID=A0A6G1CXX7_9ORYZ|nr:hypothetical protein E2562_004450 [Oryza meyeriana var. granulata]
MEEGLDGISRWLLVLHRCSLLSHRGRVSLPSHGSLLGEWETGGGDGGQEESRYCRRARVDKGAVSRRGRTGSAAIAVGAVRHGVDDSINGELGWPDGVGHGLSI